MNLISQVSLFFLVIIAGLPGFAEEAALPGSASDGTAIKTAAQKRALNPDIGVNFLGIFRRGDALSNDRTVVPHNGFALQEAELQFSADVDPYFRAVSILAIKQESGAAEYGLDPEEIFLETISLPVVTLKAGKFKTALGKHNALHTHAFPFIDAPLIHQHLLGDEGLSEIGISAAALLPVSWYSEVTIEGFSLSNEELYDSTNSGDVGSLIRLKNLWDLSADLTMEFGLSRTQGKNQFDQISSVLGTDLTFKWRPSVGGKYRALIWSTEYLSGHREGSTDETTSEPTEKLGGLSTWIQYQFAQRWWIQGRYEAVGLPHDPALPYQNKQSVLIGFFPSEFSGLRLQYDRLTTSGKDGEEHSIALQYNISIGAHPAHTY